VNTYYYSIPYADLGKLQQECIAAGLPVAYINGGTIPTDVYVVTSRPLTPGEVTILDGVVAAHDGRPRKKRLLYDILTDYNALTGTQRTKTWADVTKGTPPLWATDAGPNAASVFSLNWSATQGGAPAQQDIAKAYLISAYVQDNPKYLVNPAFDPTINLPGDMVAV
jgi:hypothetical protein